MKFSNFDIDGFLRDHWQKKPLLIRNPWTEWSNPLDPDELAGLACEDEVESRLIMQARDTWKAENGPFPESRFGKLRKKPWTLLVQAVDHHVPEVAALIEPFRFIPNWRIDDVMVSYATDEGGVGPHFDQYDVFLIQGLGRRRWQVGAHCDSGSALLSHDDLRLLARFEALDEWILEPGDILYIPPRIAHNGIAVGDDCMTYSVGFRAPSRSELLGHWCDDLLVEIEDDDRYADPCLPMQANPGEISSAALTELHAMILAKMGDKRAFARWFGQYNSTPRYPDADWRPETPLGAEDIRQILANGVALLRNTASRFSFSRPNENSLWLYVDGQCFECQNEGIAFAELLCSQTGITLEPKLARSDAVIALTTSLFNQGSLILDDQLSG